MAAKYFFDPFGYLGDRATVPDAVQSDGSVSYTQGFGPDYSLDPESDPDALLIPRAQFNEIIYQITAAVAELQTDFPPWVSAAANNGTPFPYNLDAVVRYTDGNLYQSTVAGNVSTPTASGTWVVFLSQYALQSALVAEIARAEAAEALLAPINSPIFQGSPQAPTRSPGTGGAFLATCAYVLSAVQSETNRALAAEALLAPLLSPAFAGNPTTPYPSTASSVANAQYVADSVATERNRALNAESLLAPINSPALTGVPTCPTPPPNSNDNTIPDTAWVVARIPNVIQGSIMGGARFGVPIGGSFAIGNFTWDQAFPNGCSQAVASCETNDVLNPGAAGNNMTAICYNFNANGGTVRVDTEQGRIVTGNIVVNVIGRGY